MGKRARLAVELAEAGEIERYKDSGVDELVFPLEGFCFGKATAGSLEEAAGIAALSHKAGMKCSIACDKLFAEYEIPSLQNALMELQAASVDAIVFQDPAVIGMCGIPLIYDGMTMPVSARDVEWWLQNGCAGVVLAGLLEKQEILAALSKAPCSMHVFGRPVLSVSRRMLIRAFAKETGIPSLSGRDRLRLVEEKREGRMPVFEGKDHCVIYGDFVQDMFLEVKSLVDAGLNRLEVRSAFLTNDEVFDAACAFARILDGSDVSQERQAYVQRHPLVPLERGWLDEKTVR